MAGGILAVIIFVLSFLYGANESFKFLSDTSEQSDPRTFIVAIVGSLIAFLLSLNYMYLAPRAMGNAFLDDLQSNDVPAMRASACRNSDLAATFQDPNRYFLPEGIRRQAERDVDTVFFLPISNQVRFNMTIVNGFIPNERLSGRLQIRARNIFTFCVERLDLRR